MRILGDLESVFSRPLTPTQPYCSKRCSKIHPPKTNNAPPTIIILAAILDWVLARIECLDFVKWTVVGLFLSCPLASNHVPQLGQKILVGTIFELHDQH
jgi:hypothetical protein